MNTFDLLLARVLAHSVVYEAALPGADLGLPPGWARNNFSPSAPPARDAAAEGAATLKSQIELAPQQYAAEAEYQPKYAALNRSVVNDALNGTGPNDPGYLKMASDILPQIAAQQSKAATAQRASDIGDVATLGPAATAAYRAANPQQTALVDSINREAQEGVDAGASLDPSLRREVTQGVRTGFADRGLGQGPADIYAEATTAGAAGEALRSTRLARASSAVALDKATNADPFQAILGRSVNTNIPGTVAAAGATDSGAPKMFDPFSSYGADLANTNYNGIAASKIAGANNNAAVTGAALSY